MVSGYKSNSAGWRKVLKSRGAQDATNQVAERVAARARANARVDSGDYRDSIQVEESPTPNRARSTVVANIGYGAFVEARDNTLGQALGEARQ